MTILQRMALSRIRNQYGPLWLVAIAEHWDRHVSLRELFAHVALLEEVYQS